MNDDVLPSLSRAARAAVGIAREHAGAHGASVVAGPHVLIGIKTEDPILLEVTQSALRHEVERRYGGSSSAGGGLLPLTPGVERAIAAAVRRAAERGDAEVQPAHLLLGLVEEDVDAQQVAITLGLLVDEVRQLADAAAGRAPLRQPRDLKQALGDGYPVAVSIESLGVTGDIGNVRVDACLLNVMLGAGGAAARLLRARGIDELAIQRLEKNASL